MKNSKLGIVILNYMTYKLTIKCLNNLNKMRYNNFFVVVVDNLSPNNSYKKIENYISNNIFKYKIYLIKSDKNGGYSYGNNIGIKKAESLKADYILIMNNDIVINESDFLDKLVNYLDEDEDIAMLGPGIINKQDIIELPLLLKRINPYSYIIRNMLYPFSILINKILRKKIQNCQRAIKVYAVSGCCFIIRTDILKEIHYFDDELFLYGEEYILGEKLYKKGYETYFIPNLHVVHNHSLTISSIYDVKKISDMKIKSHKYYFEKYREDINDKVRYIMICSEYFRERIYNPIIILIKNIMIIPQKARK